MVEKPTETVDPKELARIAESLATLTQNYENAREAAEDRSPTLAAGTR